MSSSLTLFNNNGLFLNQIVMCEENWILYDNQFSGQISKKLHSTSKSQTCTKKGVMVTVWWSAAIWSTTASWIPAKTSLRSMLSKSMRCAENCNTCSQHRSTERTQFVSTTMPNHISPINASKVEQIGLQSFASSAVFTRTLANWLPLLQESWQLFAGKMLPQAAGGRRCFPRVHWLLKHGFLHYKINKFTSHWQKCVDCNGSYFD